MAGFAQHNDMQTKPTQLHDFLISLGASVKVIEKSALQCLDKEWLLTFSSNVKAKTGKWVYNGYRWHAFSFNYEKSIDGHKALDYYLSLRPKRFFVFSDWGPEIGLLCEGIIPPDLSSLHTDLYVFPRSLLWTMSFTHEQPDLGPYFACQDWKVIEEKRSMTE
jgi:hypothetical protein